MPILAQPVVEIALRTPSWMCVAGGINRSVAREAFADLLPPTVLQRRTKGDFESLNNEIFKRNKSLITEILMDGNLAGYGVISRRKLNNSLNNAERVGGTSTATLLEVAATEVWTKTWIS